MADILVDVGNAQVTGTGSLDLTISGFGTPKAILGWIVNATTEDTLASNASIAAFWADDAGGAGSVGVTAETGVTTTSTQRDLRAPNGAMRLVVAGAGLVTLEAQGTIDSDDATAGPITDGWRVVIDTYSTDARIVFVLFGGSDLDAYAFSGTAGSTITPGFQADAVIGFSNGAGTGGPSANAVLSMGVTAGTTHRALALDSRDARVSDASYTRVLTAASACQFYFGAVSWSAKFDTFTSTTFDITTVTGSPGSDVIAGLALSLGGGAVSVSTVSAPSNAATDWTVSGLGFTPQAAILLQSNASAVDANKTDWGSGVGALGANAGGYVGVQADNGQATTDTSSVWSAQWIRAYDGTGTKSHDLAPSSSPFEGGGWTVDAADIATAASADQWIAIAFEAGSSGTTAGAGASALGAVASAGTGTVTPTANEGAGASTLASAAGAGTGTSSVAGAGASTLATATGAGTGAVGEVPNTGAGASALTGATSAGTGTSAIAGAGSAALETTTSSGTGTNITLETITGAGSATLDDVSSSGAGTLVIPLSGATYPLDFAAHASALLAVNPPGSSVITHRRAGIVIGYFRGFASQSAMENGSLIGGTVRASPADAAVMEVAAGDTLAWDGPLTADAYAVEQVAADGVALRRFVLRPHGR